MRRGANSHCGTASRCVGPGFASLFFAAAALGGPASAETMVDLELVIAADVSTSMRKEEKLLQQQGFADAMRHPRIVDAILRGRYRRIAVTYVEWGGDAQFKVVIPWMTIAGQSDAVWFALQLEANFPSKLRRGTSISSVLGYSSYLFGSNDYRGSRQVVDVSGDGVNNAGPLMRGVREELSNKGVTINGLPIVFDKVPEGPFNDQEEAIPPEVLISYFRDEVVAGPGAFVEPVWSLDDYHRAIFSKLLREISGNADTASATLKGPERSGWQRAR